jgi:hypothetical protein
MNHLQRGLIIAVLAFGYLLVRRQEGFGGAKSGSPESDPGRDAEGKADVRGNAKRGGEHGKEDARAEGRNKEIEA